MLYDGQEVKISSPRAAFTMGIATVYQEPSIYPDLNVVENIYMGRELKDRFGNILWNEQASASDVHLSHPEHRPAFPG